MPHTDNGRLLWEVNVQLLRSAEELPHGVASVLPHHVFIMASTKDEAMKGAISTVRRWYPHSTVYIADPETDVRER